MASTELRAAAQQALEALEKLVVGSEYEEAVEAERAIYALRAALAEPVQEPGLKAAHGWAAPKDRYAVPVLFNPYTGEPRDVRDAQSDPTGILIVPPGNAFPAAAREQP